MAKSASIHLRTSRLKLHKSRCIRNREPPGCAGTMPVPSTLMLHTVYIMYFENPTYLCITYLRITYSRITYHVLRIGFSTNTRITYSDVLRITFYVGCVLEPLSRRETVERCCRILAAALPGPISDTKQIEDVLSKMPTPQ